MDIINKNGKVMRGKDSVVRMAHAGVLRNAEEKAGMKR